MYKITLLFICLLSISSFSQKLNTSKKNLKQKELSLKNETSSSTVNDNGDESIGNQLFIDLVVKPLFFMAKVITYELLIESVSEANKNHPYMELTPHPYYNKLRGDYTFNSSTYKPLRLDISNQFLFDGHQIFGNNLNTKFRFLQRGGLEYNQVYLRESVQGKDEDFFMHDLTANYYRVRTKSFTLHYGMGATFVHSGVNKAYFTYKTGMEYFFKIPISLSFNHRGTPITNQGIYQTNLNLNFYKKNFALKTGVQFYQIGGVNYRMFAFGGKIYL